MAPDACRPTPTPQVHWAPTGQGRARRPVLPALPGLWPAGAQSRSPEPLRPPYPGKILFLGPSSPPALRSSLGEQRAHTLPPPLPAQVLWGGPGLSLSASLQLPALSSLLRIRVPRACSVPAATQRWGRTAGRQRGAALGRGQTVQRLSLGIPPLRWESRPGLPSLRHLCWLFVLAAPPQRKLPAAHPHSLLQPPARISPSFCPRRQFGRPSQVYASFFTNCDKIYMT